MGEPLASDSDKTVVADPPMMASPDPRFKLIRCLGSGGMGDVHLAEDSKLRRLVAIKTIRADLCKDDEICKRIERECLLHAKIGSHPHIVTLFDRIEHGSQINLVMEYVEGETLQDLLTKGASGGRRLSWKDGINIAVQTLEALGRIHAHGIVHRDIKPSNIIVTRDDAGAYCAKLMDFGIARMQADDEQSTMLTKDGAGGPGTPTYMAPEQIDPKAFGPVSTATDVYAMGVMLYQILSGRPPFVGSLTEVFNGHLNQQPPIIDFHGDATVPPEIKDILECALAKKPSQRFPSVKVFREELLRVAQGTLSGAPGGEDTNKTMVASSARAAAGGPEGHGATMLDTSGTRPRASISTGKLIAIIVVLLLVAAAVAAYIAFGGAKSEEGKPPENPPQNTQTAPQTAPGPDGTATPAIAPAAPDVPPAPTTPPQSVSGMPQPPAGGTPGVVPPAGPAPGNVPPPAVVSAAPAPAESPPAASASSTSAMQAFEQRLKEQSAAPAQPATIAPAEPPAPEPPAAAEPPKPKPKPPTPKPTESQPEAAKPAPAEQKPAEPQPPSTWKVIESKDRKVN
ncbi:MAG: serine/threonine-protein kinase [Candidatus Hydrogenedentes bacterium]|nr:serine/threonine-protein kinase [Candidatus Hydrogenedentota bacterium]